MVDSESDYVWLVVFLAPASTEYYVAWSYLSAARLASEIAIDMADGWNTPETNKLVSSWRAARRAGHYPEIVEQFNRLPGNRYQIDMRSVDWAPPAPEIFRGIPVPVADVNSQVVHLLRLSPHEAVPGRTACGRSFSWVNSGFSADLVLWLPKTAEPTCTACLCAPNT